MAGRVPRSSASGDIQVNVSGRRLAANAGSGLLDLGFLLSTAYAIRREASKLVWTNINTAPPPDDTSTSTAPLGQKSAHPFYLWKITSQCIRLTPTQDLGL